MREKEGRKKRVKSSMRKLSRNDHIRELPSSSLPRSFAVPKSVTFTCIRSSRRMFSGFRSLDYQHKGDSTGELIWSTRRVSIQRKVLVYVQLGQLNHLWMIPNECMCSRALLICRKYFQIVFSGINRFSFLKY